MKPIKMLIFIEDGMSQTKVGNS